MCTNSATGWEWVTNVTDDVSISVVVWLNTRHVDHSLQQNTQTRLHRLYLLYFTYLLNYYQQLIDHCMN